MSWPPRKDDDHARFIATLRKSKLLAIAANDTTLPSEIGERVLPLWQAEREGIEAMSADYDDEIREVTRLLDGEEYVLIKGAALRGRFYPDPTLRPMNDIDALVRKERVALIDAMLRRTGYVPAKGYYLKTPRNLNVEIIAPLTEETRHAVDYDEFFSERQTGPLGASLPADHHELVTQAWGIGTMMFDGHARKYLDLWLLARDPERFERAIETAHRWKMRRVFHAAICLLCRVFPDAGLEPLAERSGRKLARSERVLLEGIGLPASASARIRWRPVILTRKLALLDSNPIRLRFLRTYISDRLRTARAL